MSARDALFRAAKFPYDADDQGVLAEDRKGDWANAAARGVLSDLTDRRGIKSGFNHVHHDVRVEIVDTLAEIIRLAQRIAEAGVA